VWFIFHLASLEVELDVLLQRVVEHNIGGSWCPHSHPRQRYERRRHHRGAPRGVTAKFVDPPAFAAQLPMKTAATHPARPRPRPAPFSQAAIRGAGGARSSPAAATATIAAVLNAFIETAPPPAVGAAAALAPGAADGSGGVLAGAPIAVKANLCAVGFLATAGSKMLHSA
jgi:hypothetical protein